MNETVAIPWWKSRIILGVVVSLVCKALVVSGLTGDISSEVEQNILDAMLLVIGGAGDLWAVISRVQQTAAPTIVSSKGKAEVANAAPVLDPTEGGAWPLFDAENPRA